MRVLTYRNPRNPYLIDVGVVALAEVLMKSTQTFLTVQGLEYVGMGEEGISAVAEEIRRPR
jgi:hypothetical protein